MTPIVTTKNIDTILSVPRLQGSKIGLVTGSFDILHFGHIQLLRDAKNISDYLVVALESDEATAKSKGVSHTHNIQARSQILSELNMIDCILLLDSVYSYESKMGNTYHDMLVKNLRPKYLATSVYADPVWKLKKNRIETAGGEIYLSNALYF